MDEKAHENHVVKAREETIDEDIRGIYEDESGELPDLSTLESPVRSWRKGGLAVAAVLLVLTLGIWAAFFFSGGFTFRGAEYLALEVIARPIEVEEERAEPLVSGAPARIAVRYENVTNAPIASLSIRLNLPDALLVDRFVPEPTGAGNTWDLGSLAPGSDGVIELYGTLLGDIPSSQNIQIIATYRPANFSSEFDEIVLHELILEESALALNVATPDKASPGEDVILVYELLNPSAGAVGSVELHAVVPEGFQTRASEPAILEGFLWKIPRMEAHSKASFTLTGTVSANTRGLHDAGGRVYLTRDTRRYLQVESLRPLDVFGGAIALDVIVNGSARDQNVDPGILLRVSIPVKNASEADVGSVELALEIESVGESPVDWSASGLNLGGGVRSGNQILWNETDLEAFERLRPGEEATVDLTLPLYASLPETSGDALTLTATIGARPSTNASSRITLSTTPVTIRVNSLVDLYTSAVYHDTSGTPLGSGPLPPRVLETTTYAIIWSVSSDLHPLENGVLEVELPADVRFEEGIQTSEGSLSYRVDRRSVRWEIPRLEGSASARFNVSVTPDADDVGSFMRLTNPASLTARDEETGSQIRRDGSTLTTVLTDDAFAEDDGIVGEE